MSSRKSITVPWLPGLFYQAVWFWREDEMGGKKKSLATRLAKMSDEERARYLQRKADVEEEARRRKEQLIAIFMKTKIKREDGFSRLNLAKINQQWHQILRLDKCKEMREDVEHLKKYMDRILDYKNRTIDKLLEELEMAEEQYLHNFQAHFTHIDQIIVSHERYMGLMEEQYQKDLEEFLDISAKERSELLERNTSQNQHLQTIIFGQETKFQESVKSAKERYLQKKEDLTSTFRIKLDSYIKQRENHCGALWRQIATVIKSHVTQTDARRLHLAELKRLDAESAAEIASNQERITSQEEEIKLLNQQFENLTAKRTQTLEDLRKRIQTETSKFFSARKTFRKEVEKDDRLITLLTDRSTKIITFLEKIKSRGDQIVTLMTTCQKFETEREQATKWLPLTTISDVDIDEEEKEEMKRRKSAGSGDEMVKKVVISVKSPQGSPPSSAGSKEHDVIRREFALLEQMEKFWEFYNRVDIDYKELKREKKLLVEQNKHFRGMIRAVLEAAALDQTTPNSKVSTRVASQRRGPVSAPLRRIII